ncbi:MAG: GNAT family N-acetyltransferase [Candidatus Bathyarchaeota archaeon]|nr:GNAT family N-acetyltransferase [Candidatus Bathyarchaeota archaeon]
MLIGEKINLRLMERSELNIVQEWENNSLFTGPYEPIQQSTLESQEKLYDERGDNEWFFITQKDGEPIGLVFINPKSGYINIGYAVVEDARGKGVCSEAVRMIVDYLFLRKNIVRIQASINPDNLASEKVLTKNGFTREGVLRQSFYSRGVYRDTVVFSILRDEWKGPYYNW